MRYEWDDILRAVWGNGSFSSDVGFRGGLWARPCLTTPGTPGPPTPSRERGCCLAGFLGDSGESGLEIGLDGFSRRGKFVRAWWKMSAWNDGLLKTSCSDWRIGLVLGGFHSGRPHNPPDSRKVMNIRLNIVFGTVV